RPPSSSRLAPADAKAVLPFRGNWATVDAWFAVFREVFMAHRFKIVSRANGQFGAQFVYNSEIIFWSENYTTKASAQNCIDSLKKNAPGAETADLSQDEQGKGYRFEI